MVRINEQCPYCGEAIQEPGPIFPIRDGEIVSDDYTMCVTCAEIFCGAGSDRRRAMLSDAVARISSKTEKPEF
jgi:hypothetical protein